MVFVTVIESADTTTNSPPAPAGNTCAVDSPGSGGVMKRETYTRVPSAVTETCRGLRPMLAVARIAPVDASSLSNALFASSATNANPPVGANAMPKGCEAYGNTTVCETVSVEGSMTLMVAACLFATQTRPALPSNTMLLDMAGRFAVSGACTTCVTVSDCAGFPSDEAVTVT